MSIDIPTLVLIIGITHTMQVLVLYYQYKTNKEVQGPGWWLMWSAAEIIGFLLILLRDIPSLHFTVILLQNPIIFLGTIFVYIGVKRFFDEKLNFRLIFSGYLIFIIFQFFFFLIVDNIAVRTFIFDLFLAIVGFLTAFVLYKNKKPNIASTLNFNTALFTIHGSIFAYRAIMIALGYPATDLHAHTLVNYLQFIDALIVGLLWTFGFIIMLNQELNAKINEAKIHFETIFNTNPDAAVITRLSDGKVVDCNDSYVRISGYSRDETLNKSTFENNIWIDPAEREKLIELATTNGSVENFEFLYREKGGAVKTGLLSASLITLFGETHLITVTHDITGRKIKEAEIRLKNEELKILINEKDKFFSIIAHDLRNPIISFLKVMQIMDENLPSMDPDEIRMIVNTMKGTTTNLYNLLENLLEWSRMERNMIGFDPKPIIVSQLLKETLSPILEQAIDKDIEIVTRIPKTLMILADLYMLGSTLRNLISNAVKFTERGGIINISAKETGHTGIEISIEDNGIGMNKQIMDNLFRLDALSGRPGTEGEQSTGLGLLLCKEFVEKHNGKIWAESNEKQGSTFFVWLPLMQNKTSTT